MSEELKILKLQSADKVETSVGKDTLNSQVHFDNKVKANIT